MKQSQIEKVLAELEGEKAAIQLAIDKLRNSQASKPQRVRKLKAVGGEGKLA